MQITINGKSLEITPEKLTELTNELITELGGETGINDLIRKQKACKIEDIMRGARLAQCYDHRFVTELRNPSAFFDKLYELDLDTLEAYSAGLDKLNTEYMRSQVFKHNAGF